MNQISKMGSAALGLVASVLVATAGLAEQRQTEADSRSETAAGRIARHAKSLHLGPGSTIEPVRDGPDRTGHVYEYRHKFRGVPVNQGRIVIIERSNGGLYVNSTPAPDLARDITSTSATLSPQQALTIAKRAALVGQNANVPTEGEKAEKMIYVNDNGVAHVTYKTGFFVAHPREPSAPTFFIDANSGAILKQWDDLMHANATGLGGNQTSGQYKHGAQRLR